jgi:hypothetical protein
LSAANVGCGSLGDISPPAANAWPLASTLGSAKPQGGPAKIKKW